MRALLLALLLGSPAYGQEVLLGDGQDAPETAPPPGFFTGVFERVGRDSQDPPGLINDLVRIAPTPTGWGLSLKQCAVGEGVDLPSELRHSLFDEVPNILEGAAGPSATAIWCQYFTDHSNYPVLTCSSEDGARFTLWAVSDERAAACAP